MPEEIVIRPKKTFDVEVFREVWRYRELLYFFCWRDLKVRYKQTAIGVLWALLQPLVTMIIFSVFFGRLAGIPSDGAPYPIFVFVGLLIWQFFSTSLADTSNSLIDNKAILTKVYFPRLILPLSSVLTKLIDFAIASLILVGLMVYYRYTPNLLGLLALPFLILIAVMTRIGAGFLLSSINVKYRDVRYALPFFIQTLLFLTPVIYPPGIAGRFSWILALNPMTGVIKTARSVILGTTPVNELQLALSVVSAFILLVAGIYVFKETEIFFADIV